MEKELQLVELHALLGLGSRFSPPASSGSSQRSRGSPRPGQHAAAGWSHSATAHGRQVRGRALGL